GAIDNSHRAIGAALTGEHLTLRGSAGQSFGAWLDAGTELVLEGEANDYVGKGMGGGVIVIRPFDGDGSAAGDFAETPVHPTKSGDFAGTPVHPTKSGDFAGTPVHPTKSGDFAGTPVHPTKSGDFAGTPVLAGNTCLYGATGGRLFLAGRAGDRFGVRNSAAGAAVEGTGDHLCEYMTGGAVVALGPVGWNVGAGMTGGVAYVREWGQLNADSVVVRHVPTEDAEQLRELVEEHHRRTGSRLAAELLSDWQRALQGFRQVVPVASFAAPQ